MLFDLPIEADVAGLAVTLFIMLVLMFKGEMVGVLLVFGLQLLLFW